MKYQATSQITLVYNVHNLINDITYFTVSLSTEIEVIIIEQVDVSGVEDDSQIKLRECKKRE